MASIQSRADRELAKLDRKVALNATYRIRTGTTVNTDTGVITPAYTNITDVKVRSNELSIQNRRDLTQAGLIDVTTSYKIRRAYFADYDDHEPKSEDLLSLTVSGFIYEVLQSQLDRVHADWILYLRRHRS